MYTGSILNNSLTLYVPDTVTGIDTSFLYVFDDNVFKTISTAFYVGNTIGVVLADSVDQYGNVQVVAYPGAYTTTSANLSTTFVISNPTIYFDNTQPSLLEMVEHGDYNYTSYVYSNYITGITTQSNFPTADVVLKRNPPEGEITINEGFLGEMRVRRFVGMSSALFDVGISGLEFQSYKNFAFDYNSYGDHTVAGVKLFVGTQRALPSNARAYLTINEDYFISPSPVVLGMSTVLDLSGLQPGQFYEANFEFDVPIDLSSGRFWFVFTPTVDSSMSVDDRLVLKESVFNNSFTNLFYQSLDGFVFEATDYRGCSFQVSTDRGIVLPTIDAVFNQLDEPQNVVVEYGDQSDLNTYTSIAVSDTKHYIKKNFLDDYPVYAVEVLADSSGQNHYGISGAIGTSVTQYFEMIANPLTENIIRFEFLQPQYLDNLKLTSKGDYYTQSSLGKVLVSASDFLGVSKVEIASSSDFPEASTTVINLSPSQQKYIASLDYDFGDLGKKFDLMQDQIGGSLKYVFVVTVSGERNYLLVGDTSIYLYDDDDTASVVLALSDANFLSAVVGTTGIIITDSRGRIYNYAAGAISNLGTLSEIPMASATQATTTYIGISTTVQSSRPSRRKRIYSIDDGVISHLSWSTQIPETQITFIYAASFGLIIGAYEPSSYVGKIYRYYNSQLTQLYSTYLRPDAAFYSSSTNRLYVALDGSQILTSTYASGKFSTFVETGINLAGSLVRQINSTRITGKIFVVTDANSYIFDESTYVATMIQKPPYSSTDQTGLLVQVQNLDLGLTPVDSRFVSQTYSNVYYDFLANGYSSSFRYTADGYIVFNGISTTGVSTSFYLNLPENTTLENLTFNNKTLSTTVFSGIFYPSVPQRFSLSVYGDGLSGIGTLSLHNGVSSAYPVVGIASFVPSKVLNYYLKTGSTDDIFAFADGSLRSADMSELSSNQYNVYARFTDVVGNVNEGDTIASDTIYSQIQQQINGQALPSGRIVQVDTNDNVTSFTPSEGTNAFIYSGSKIVRQTGVFESDPFYAADVTSWDVIQVLAQIPAVAPPGSTDDHGTSVKLEVKTAYSLLDLTAATYTNSYELSTINNGDDYTTYASIAANISSLSGTWLQFRLTLTTASANVSPLVQSVLITYNGAGKSVFVTKTFDTSVQSSITPTPRIRRGILTANFVTNSGVITFGYTTDPDDGNPSNYTPIIPNQIFTLDTPSSIIKFGIILKTATSSPCFVDEFAVQLDLGPDDLYFMPPQAYFEIQPYYDESGILVLNAYQFVNKSVGIVSSYNWSFGTSYPEGIATYYPPDEDPVAGPAIYRQNPVIGYADTGVWTVGLFITGWVEDGVFFNSELYTRSFIST